MSLCSFKHNINAFIIFTFGLGHFRFRIPDIYYEYVVAGARGDYKPEGSGIDS
jgi:hypothetical protein